MTSTNAGGGNSNASHTRASGASASEITRIAVGSYVPEKWGLERGKSKKSCTVPAASYVCAFLTESDAHMAERVSGYRNGIAGWPLGDIGAGGAGG